MNIWKQVRLWASYCSTCDLWRRFVGDLADDIGEFFAPKPHQFQCFTGIIDNHDDMFDVFAIVAEGQTDQTVRVHLAADAKERIVPCKRHFPFNDLAVIGEELPAELRRHKIVRMAGRHFHTMNFGMPAAPITENTFLQRIVDIDDHRRRQKLRRETDEFDLRPRRCHASVPEAVPVVVHGP